MIAKRIALIINTFSRSYIPSKARAISLIAPSALFDTSTAIELRIMLIIFGCVLGYAINRINFRKYLVLLKRNLKSKERLKIGKLNYSH